MELRAPTRVASSFYQTLLINSRPVKVVTEWIQLPYLSVISRTGPAFVIPIHEDTRQKLDEVETFVKAHYNLPADLQQQDSYYKPLSGHSPMTVKMKDHCCCFVYHPHDDFEIVSIRHFPVSQKGWYRFTINVSSVYIAPHQEDVCVSIIPRVVS